VEQEYLVVQSQGSRLCGHLALEPLLELVLELVLEIPELFLELVLALILQWALELLVSMQAGL
jgi:hypothetical protein